MRNATSNTDMHETCSDVGACIGELLVQRARDAVAAGTVPIDAVGRVEEARRRDKTSVKEQTIAKLHTLLTKSETAPTPVSLVAPTADALDVTSAVQAIAQAVSDVAVPSLVVLRGLPGSGKSTLAQLLVAECEGVTNTVLSSKLFKASHHTQCFHQVLHSLQAQTPLVIVDDDNASLHHCTTYRHAARVFGYAISVVELVCANAATADAMAARAGASSQHPHKKVWERWQADAGALHVTPSGVDDAIADVAAAVGGGAGGGAGAGAAAAATTAATATSPDQDTAPGAKALAMPWDDVGRAPIPHHKLKRKQRKRQMQELNAALAAGKVVATKELAAMAAAVQWYTAKQTAALFRGLAAGDSKSSSSSTASTASTTITVVEGDCVETAVRLQLELEAGGGSKGERVVMLDMASDRRPGGGALSGAAAQEESVCRRTTLHHALMAHEEHWPLAAGTVIYLPKVLVLRDREDMGCAWLPQHVGISIVAGAALRHPEVTSAGDMGTRDTNEFRTRIQGLLAVCAAQGHKHLVLSAWGCGAFGCPPKAVGGLFRAVLTSKRFRGAFERVVFAVIDDHNGKNFAPFQAALM